MSIDQDQYLTFTVSKPKATAWKEWGQGQSHRKAGTKRARLR